MEIINFQGRFINILGSVYTPYFIGFKKGRILGFIQPHNAIWNHVWQENKIKYSDLLGVWFRTTPSNSNLLASY